MGIIVTALKTLTDQDSNMFSRHCPKCNETIEDKSDVCLKCGFSLVESEVEPKSIENESNGIASIMKGLGVVVIICGFIAGIVLGRDRYDDFSFSAAIIWWLGGFVSGMFSYALGEIVSLLQKIHDKFQ